MLSLQSKTRRGLSLIELVVVLAILSFALTAVLPSVTDWVQNLAVRNAAESLRAGLERARQEALRRNVPMTFWLVADSAKTLTNGCARSSAGPSYVVSKLDPSGQCGAAPSSAAAPRIADKWSAVQGGSNVILQTQNAAGNAVDSVTFNTLGQPGAGQLARIDVEHSAGSARKLRLSVEPGGSIRLCDPDPALAASDPRRCS